MSNTEIVKTGMKAWESNDVQTMTELVADDFVLSGPTPQPLGKQEFIGLMQILHAGTPDFAFNVSSYEEHDDAVIAKAHITATHTGVLALPGMPPIPATGKKVALPEESKPILLRMENWRRSLLMRNQMRAFLGCLLN